MHYLIVISETSFFFGLNFNLISLIISKALMISGIFVILVFRLGSLSASCRTMEFKAFCIMTLFICFIHKIIIYHISSILFTDFVIRSSS